jgi:hypothetical protein
MVGADEAPAALAAVVVTMTRTDEKELKTSSERIGTIAKCFDL